MPTMANGVDFESVLLRMLQEDAGLSALVGSKVFPLFIPSGNYLPCVTFQRLGGRPANTLSGASGLEEIDLQIDVWAREQGRIHRARQIHQRTLAHARRAGYGIQPAHHSSSSSMAAASFASSRWATVSGCTAQRITCSLSVMITARVRRP